MSLLEEYRLKTEKELRDIISTAEAYGTSSMESEIAYLVLLEYELGFIPCSDDDYDIGNDLL